MKAPAPSSEREAALMRLVKKHEQSLMSLMAIQEELRTLPGSATLEDLIRVNVELATTTKRALELARDRLRVERERNALFITPGTTLNPFGNSPSPALG